jgi:hypothetical protein
MGVKLGFLYIFRDEYTFGMSENRVLRKAFGSKRE